MAEYFDGLISAAMETVEDDAAVVFLFTKGSNFQYTIGVAGVKFENLDN